MLENSPSPVTFAKVDTDRSGCAHVMIRSSTNSNMRRDRSVCHTSWWRASHSRHVLRAPPEPRMLVSSVVVRLRCRPCRAMPRRLPLCPMS